MADARIAELERRIKEAEERAERDEKARREAEERTEREIKARREAEQQAALDRQARRDAERLTYLLRAQNAELQRAGEAARRERNDQFMRRYLWQMSRMREHVVRLIPLPTANPKKKTTTTSVPEARAIVDSMAAATKRSSDSSTTKSATNGRTSIEGKYYPLKVRPWTDFVEQQQKVFSSIDERLADRCVFPSSIQVQAEETLLQESLPPTFLHTDSFLNESRTHDFLGITLERPASKVLEAYFTASDMNRAIFFDNLTAGVRKVRVASSTSKDGSISLSPFRSLHMDSPTQVGTDPDVASQNEVLSAPGLSQTVSVPDDSAASPTSNQKKSKTETKKTRPDCLILTRDLDSVDDPEDAEDPGDDGEELPGLDETRRLMVGEHKPCHMLLARDLAANPTVAEDILVRMAVARNLKKLKEQKKKQSKLVTKSVSDINNAMREQTATQDSPEEGQPPTRDGQDAWPEKHVYFASALAQAYHYILTSGLEYGYLATGETLTLLRIPEEDATTLLYHTCFFPGLSLDQLPKDHKRPVYPTGLTAENDANLDMAHLDATAVSQVSALGLMALDAPLRDAEWMTEAYTKLTPFPLIPDHLAHRYTGTSSSSRRPRPDSSDSGSDSGSDGGNDDNNNDGDADDEGSQRGRGRPRQLTRLQSNEEGRAPSPLRQVHGAARSPPNPSYCTQACLLGVVQGSTLDPACPNYDEHRHTPNATGTVTPHTHHPITVRTLQKLVRAQLRRHPEENCKPLFRGQRGGAERGAVGSIGRLLKISLTGYGYTFVAKAVEREDAPRLRRESHVYKALHRQQGVSIPVFLGRLRLEVPYPVPADFTVLTDVLLLSYAGITLHYDAHELEDLGQQLGGRDLEEEIDQTYTALEEWGVFDLDDKVCNATLCDETGRVMKIDFDHARLNRAVYAEKLQAVLAEEKAEKEKKEEKEKEEEEEKLKVQATAETIGSLKRGLTNDDQKKQISDKGNAVKKRRCQ